MKNKINIVNTLTLENKHRHTYRLFIKKTKKKHLYLTMSHANRLKEKTILNGLVL